MCAKQKSPKQSVEFKTCNLIGFKGLDENLQSSTFFSRANFIILKI